jgi:sugar fermentation stimulation protein A
MKFVPALRQGVLLRRYKRFLADVQPLNRAGENEGDELTIHCPNTGSMKNCLAPGEHCWFSTSSNLKRKYPNTWEVATTPQGHLAGVNTGLANVLVREALEAGLIEALQGFDSLRAEVPYGEERSRIDFLLEFGAQTCFVEVKSVTLWAGDDRNPGRGLFPDSVSVRATKHLRELMQMRAEGHRAVLLYCVQHSGISSVSPADELDPSYGKTLREAIDKGVEVLAYGADISPLGIELRCALPIVL